MKKETISQAINNISTHHIEEAQRYHADKKTVGASRKIWGRAAIAAAAVICIASISIPAIANPIGGFFKNIFRFDGAIVGTSYQNATDEIKISASNAINKAGKTLLSLDITFLEMESKEPFIYLKNGSAAIGDYRILDGSGKEIYTAKGQQEPSAALDGDKANLTLTIEGAELLAGEKYTIVIEYVYGLQKAEQPLGMSGVWECEFTVEK